MEADKIDIVVPVNGEGKTEIVIADQLPWKIDEGDHLIMLQDKINACLAYVEGGQLYDDFPKAKGRALILRINGLYAPSPKGENFLAAVRPIVKQICSKMIFDLWTRDRLPTGFPLQEF